jgi:hypothetical protein
VKAIKLLIIAAVVCIGTLPAQQLVGNVPTSSVACTGGQTYVYQTATKNFVCGSPVDSTAIHAASTLTGSGALLKDAGAGTAGESALVDSGTEIQDNALRRYGLGTWARTGNTLGVAGFTYWGGSLVVGDPSTLGTESLTNGALTAGTSWTRTGDFALSGGAAVYTHSSGAGTIVQANGTLAVKLADQRWYTFVYTVTGVTAGVTLSLPTAICDTTFTCTFDSTAGAAKVFYFKTAVGASALAFTVNGASTAGGLTLDTLSLKEVQGGNVTTYGQFLGGGTSGIKVLGNGNVGIGTTAPSAMLSVGASNQFTVNSAGNVVASGNSAQFYLVRPDTSNYGEYAYLTGSTFDWTLGTRSGNSNFHFYKGNLSVVGSFDAMILDTIGNLSLPSGTLTVSGTGNTTIAGNVGIGTAFPTGAPSSKQVTVGSTTIYDSTSLGAEQAASDAACTGWTLPAGWACNASGVITHTASGGTGAAEYTPSPLTASGYNYHLVATVTVTASSFMPSVGGVSGASVAASASPLSIDIAATGAGHLLFTPLNAFAGTINVQTLSLKKIVGGSLNVARISALSNRLAGTCTAAGFTCTATFNAAYTVIPVCTANDQTAIAPVQTVPAVGSLVMNVSALTGAGATDVLAYHCIGNPN